MEIKKWIIRFLRPDSAKKEKNWREDNSNNFTEIDVCSSGIENITIGRGTYGNIKVYNDSKDYYLRIGHYCSIAKDVTFIVGLDHHTDFVSTYPFKQMYGLVSTDYRDSISKGDIIVKDDVWIGYGATILSGVEISQCAIVAAGAVVTSNVPPYAIVGGVPARVIKYRFEKPIIDYLLTLDYSQLSEDLIEEHVNDLYENIDKNLKDIKTFYEWFPKKHEVKND